MDVAETGDGVTQVEFTTILRHGFPDAGMAKDQLQFTQGLVAAKWNLGPHTATGTCAGAGEMGVDQGLRLRGASLQEQPADLR